MSFTGRIEAKCPGCSETEDFEIWSFVRGDLDESLRDRLKGGELNVLECPHCGRLFAPETSWVYADAAQDLLAFVFPESHGPEEERWRAKMKEDFERIRPVAETMGLREEPLVFFGAQPLADLIHKVEDLEDESQVAEWQCRSLALSLRRVKPAFARARGLPRALPYVPSAGRFSRAGAVSGVKKLLRANDRLESYQGWLEYLKGPGPEPPASAEEGK